MITVLFACIHNAGRSQMAAAFFNALADPVRARAMSAGTEPATHVHPEVREAMAEIGVDLGAAQPTRLTASLARDVQVLITMGCGETCPYVPGVEYVDWQVPDPKGQPAERVREIRDALHARVAELVRARGWQR